MQIPVLVDNWAGSRINVVTWANRNGNFYVLDRATGRFLLGRPFVKVNWMSEFDERGRPKQTPQPPGQPTYPGNQGGTNWYSPSYSPRTGLFYVSAWEDYASIYSRVPRRRRTRKARTSAAAARGTVGPCPARRVWPRAHQYVDRGGGSRRGHRDRSADREQKWKFKMTDVTDSGILTTASDLLFTGGREGYFQALDARTGALLWKTNLGAAINSGPITYRVGNSSTCPSCPGCRSSCSRSTTSGAQPCQALAAAPRHIGARYPEDEASQQDTEPRRICKTSIPGPNPSGASNPSL